MLNGSGLYGYIDRRGRFLLEERPQPGVAVQALEGSLNADRESEARADAYSLNASAARPISAPAQRHRDAILRRRHRL